MHFARVSSSIVLIVVVGCLVTPAAPQTLTISNTLLLQPDGSTRPLIAIDSEGHTAMVSASLLTSGTDLWTGSFGLTPLFQGKIDSALQQTAKQIFDAANSDIDIGSTGTLHATTLVVLVNAPFRAAQVGVSAISCPNGATNFSLSSCTSKIIDSAGDDLPWIT